MSSHSLTRRSLPVGTAVVSGPSMVPTLSEGDKVVIRYGAPVRPGDLVVARHPLQQNLLVVKRAAERRPGGWWLLGDNPYAEGDSRTFGVVPDELLVARVLLRYQPRPSWLRRPRLLRAVPASRG